MYKDNPKIISFLKECTQYNVLHEKSVSDSKIEHYFMLVTKQDTLHTIIEDCLNEYEKNYPIKDLSKISTQYISSKKKEYHYIYLDKLDKTDVFFLEKEKVLKENAHNILALKIIGETIDLQKHLEINAIKYLSQFKEISKSMGIIAKEELFKKIQENKPVVRETFNKIKQKIKNRG